MPVWLKELLTSVVVAGLASLPVALLEGRRRRRTGFGWLFLTVLAATWAGGIWLQPFGPKWQGVHWLPFLAAGAVFALVVALIGRDHPPRGRQETIEKLEAVAQEKQFQAATGATLGVFFWVLLAILLLAVLARYRLR